MAGDDRLEGLKTLPKKIYHGLAHVMAGGVGCWWTLFSPPGMNKVYLSPSLIRWLKRATWER
ncbi:hypothetical protein DRO32_03575 [Candidatus Bathyarchaeota archaeon]|nr:MAG: hypothetical protein DRO32_03575 [Candidatus Bathyarchaeota archaeon]